MFYSLTEFSFYLCFKLDSIVAELNQLVFSIGLTTVSMPFQTSGDSLASCILVFLHLYW